MKPIKRMLLRIARIRWLGAVIGFAFEHAAVLIPIRRIARTRHAIAFDHPVPTEPLHRLVIPLKRAATLFDLLAGPNQEVVSDVLACAERATDGADGAYALEINAGARQDVMQAHFHLIRSKGAPTGADSVPVIEVGPGDNSLLSLEAGRQQRVVLVICPPDNSGTWDRRALSALLVSTIERHGALLRASHAATVRVYFECQASGATWHPHIHIDRESGERS